MTNKLLKEDEILKRQFNKLVDKVREYNSGIKLKNLKKAFHFSKKTHLYQYRDSGEPYLTHPLEVALILTEYFADEDTIIAAILHDTVEDTEEVSIKTIKTKFGATVADLVDGATKIEKIIPEDASPSLSFDIKRERNIETIRKIFQKANQDIRVILIKLADRLHNMRTLSGKKGLTKQNKKAKETLSIFTQVAARLGIWKIKRELEDLCFKYVYPEDYKIIQDFLTKEQQKREQILQTVKESLLKEDSKNVFVEILPYDRGIVALQKAFQEKKNLTINDNLVLQIQVKDENSCYLILRLIHSLWRHRGTEEDFISNPRDNGYESYHTEIVTQEGNRVQFRIMTPEMQRRNRFGITYDYFQKKQGATVHFLCTSFEKINKNTIGKSEDFLEATKTDLLERKIKIHTKGKSIDMPVCATALDFSFYCFPEEAVYTSQILINDKEVHLGTSLQEGDIVEIKHFSQETVTFSWFYQIKTILARMAIQEHLRKWDSEQKMTIGKEILQKEFDLYETGRVESFFHKNGQAVKEAFHVKNEEELYTLIAEGTIKPYDVFLKCFPKIKGNLLRRSINFMGNILERIFLKKKRKQIRLKIEGILDNAPQTIQEIQSIRHKLKIDSINSNLKENRESNTFALQIDAETLDQSAFHYFMVELERVPGIIRTTPLLSYIKQKIFILWGIVTVLMWASLPSLLSWTQIYSSQIGNITKMVLVYINLLPILIINYLLYSFIRNYFPQIRNTLWLIFIAILLNIIGIGIFIWQLLLHDLHLDLYIILTVFFSINFIFLYQYLTQRILFLRIEQKEKLQQKNIPRNSKIIGYACGITSTLIWGLNPIMIRFLVLDQKIVFFTVGMRLYMGGISLFIFLYFLKILRIRKGKQLKTPYTKFFWLIVIGLAGNFLLFHWGLRYTTASNANLLENFAPIVILLVMGFLIPKFSHQIGHTKKDIIKTLGIVAVGSIGASLILSYFPQGFFIDYKTKLFGDFIEIIAMLFFAMFIMGSNFYMKESHVSSLQVTAKALLIAAVCFTPFIFIEPIPSLTGEQWFWLSMIGIVSTGIAYTLWNHAAKSLNVIPASLLLNFTVVVTILVEHQLTGLPLSMTMIIGAILMIFASVSAELINIKREKIIEIGR